MDPAEVSANMGGGSRTGEETGCGAGGGGAGAGTGADTLYTRCTTGELSSARELKALATPEEPKLTASSVV